ncbi:MAG: SGNH/GDSL hydrolase family protein [Chthoniobacteraceae bacterium]
MKFLTGLFLSLMLAIPSLHAEILVQDGAKVAFLGDSITAAGWGNPNGYVRLIVSGLAANGIKVEPIPAGIGGHKSNQMLERLDRDVLSKKPDWMTLSCGVNDVWHHEKGVPLPEYKENITKLVEQATAAGVKVMILTATVIQEDLGNADNATLAGYNDFLRELAKEKKLPLADLNTLFQERIKAENKPGQKVLTGDGVHMNNEGDQLMAIGVLQAFGLNEAELAKAQDAWKSSRAETK